MLAVFLVVHAVLASLGQADTESLQETAFSRRGDDHGSAVLHPLGPAEIKAAFRERGPYRTRDVWPSLGPIETPSTEMTTSRTHRKEVDPKLREEFGARFSDLGGFLAEHDVFVRGEKIGEVHAETTGKVVVGWRRSFDGERRT